MCVFSGSRVRPGPHAADLLKRLFLRALRASLPPKPGCGAEIFVASGMVSLAVGACGLRVKLLSAIGGDVALSALHASGSRCTPRLAVAVHLAAVALSVFAGSERFHFNFYMRDVIIMVYKLKSPVFNLTLL